MKPPKSILDRTFKYVPAAQTDLAKRFAAIRRDMAAQAKLPKATVREIGRKVK